MKKVTKYNKQVYDKRLLKEEEQKYNDNVTVEAPLKEMWNKFLKEPVLLGYMGICILSWYVSNLYIKDVPL